MYELAGTVAVLKFTLKQLSGGETNIVLGTGTASRKILNLNIRS